MELVDRFVSLVHGLAGIVGPGPAVALIAVTAGAAVWVPGMVVILILHRRGS